MSSANTSFPWYVSRPNGEIDPIAIPDRLVRHPGVQQRGLTLTDTMKPGVVYPTHPYVEPAYVVKILNPSSEELAVYQRLRSEAKRPNNHTIPFEISLDDHPILIMPMAGSIQNLPPKKRTPQVLVDLIFQMVEGLEFLHSLHIVHMDINVLNVLVAFPRNTISQPAMVADRFYIIDFDISQQFTLGPGVQRAITLPQTRYRPPNGLQHFDPYSWDVHCAGRTLEWYEKQWYQYTKEKPYWLAQQYIKWLIGNERGCTSVCRCRPTARTALRVAVVLHWALYVTEGYSWVAAALSRLWAPYRSD